MTTTTPTVNRATMRNELARIHDLALCGAEQLIFEALLEEITLATAPSPFDDWPPADELFDEGDAEQQFDPNTCDEFDEERIARVLLYVQLDRDDAAERAEQAVQETLDVVKVWTYNAFVAGVELSEVALLSGLSADALADCESMARTWVTRNADNPAARSYWRPERRERVRTRLRDEADQLVVSALTEGADIGTAAALTRRTTCDVRAIAARS